MNNKFSQLFKDINVDNGEKIDIPVVIMAGGIGSRLRPITNILPKPLIPIGDVTIVERIINNFLRYGCNNFFLTINYKKDIILKYFRNMELDYNLECVVEDKPLGTAGGLKLLKGMLNQDFFLSNCDILVEGNYADMLDYHIKNENKITCIAALNEVPVPYGVFDIDATGRIYRLREKPKLPYIVNTGMYILSPEVIDYIPDDESYNLTKLITDLIMDDKKVGVYPIYEKDWLDMGNFDSLDEMLESLGLNK